jgi:hypothetical protein
MKNESKNLELFFSEIEAVCKKYGYSISHEDEHGSFEIEEYDQENIDWLKNANVRVVKVTKTKTHEPMGEYQPTELDELKEKHHRLTSICGKYRTVHMKNGEVKTFVGKREWEKWASQNDYITDF